MYFKQLLLGDFIVQPIPLTAVALKRLFLH